MILPVGGTSLSALSKPTINPLKQQSGRGWGSAGMFGEMSPSLVADGNQIIPRKHLACVSLLQSRMNSRLLLISVCLLAQGRERKRSDF